MPDSNSPPERIVVRVPQWLGDAVVSTVFVSRLRRRFPAAHIAVACRPYLEPVFAGHPHLDAVVPLPKSAGTFGAARLLKEGRFDTAYVLPKSARTALEPWLAGIPRRIGFGGDLRRVLFTATRRYRFDLLYPRRYLALLDDDGVDLEATPPHFPSAEPPPDRLAAIFDGPPERRPRPFLALAPASIAPARTWDADRFTETVRRFQRDHGGTVILIGTEKERAVIDGIKAQLTGPVVDTGGKLSLPELGWLISQCDRFLANDSGLMHVAACFRVPTVIPFGSSDPKLILPPWGTFAGPYRQVIDCQPCRRNHCVRFAPLVNACLKAVTVDDVSAELDRLGPLPERRHE
jgi:heptosyltransferase-2